MSNVFSSVKRLLNLSRDSLRESLFRNIGVPYRNIIGLLLGATAALLPLTSGTWSIQRVTGIFLLSLALTMVFLILVRPNIVSEYTKEFERFAWGLMVIMVLGFGFGALIFQSRSWWIWLWNQYRRINEPHELVLESLFLLGVILGVFVVRNWSKEQKDFQASLSGILSGTFIAAVLGSVLQELTPMRALAYYALGFTTSGTVNLILAARLTANYTNKRSISSRAILDFLYGSERAKIIDGYFLKNFQEDVDYAKRHLTETLLEYRNLVKREFADQLNQRMIERRLTPAQEESLTPQCSDLRAAQTKERELRLELKSPQANAATVRAEKEADLATVKEHIAEVESRLTPSYFYELFAIECPEKKPNSPSAIQDMDLEYGVIYKRIDINSPITKEMFRVGVANRWQDSLEYIIAPGEYRGSFPYFGSVAGLSLIVRQTIIMNRDRKKQFRSKDYRDGICPRDIEQWRGLDEIDFLSYLAIPVVSRLGSSTENAIGVVNIDTRLFATHCKLDGQPVEGSEGMFRTILTPRQLNEFASNLYEQEDKVVGYIETLTKLIVPVLELYSKCRVGAT